MEEAFPKDGADDGTLGSRGARSRYVGALDGLRVLAILAVLVYHANPSWLPGGYFGVTVFFRHHGLPHHALHRARDRPHRAP